MVYGPLAPSMRAGIETHMQPERSLEVLPGHTRAAQKPKCSFRQPLKSVGLRVAASYEIFPIPVCVTQYKLRAPRAEAASSQADGCFAQQAIERSRANESKPCDLAL